MRTFDPDDMAEILGPPVPLRLVMLRKRAGVSRADLAKLLGYAGASSIQRYEEPDAFKGYLPFEFVQKLVPVLVGRGQPPIDEGDVLELAGPYSTLMAQTVGAAKPARPADGRDAVPAAPPGSVPADWITSGATEFPIYSSAQGGPDGAPVLSNDPVEYISTPGPLAKVRGGFGVYVTGDSMEPAYENGDIALVHPYLPVRAGDDVLFQGLRPDGSVNVVIKRLLGFDATNWKVKQFNPAKSFGLARKEWQTAQVVVGKYRRR